MALVLLNGKMSKRVEWLSRETPKCITILENLIMIGDSLWYSTSHKSVFPDGNPSENGMVEYDTRTNKIINIAEYPQNIKPLRHCCCQYQQKIYLIDGENGNIILFDPVKKTFTKKLEIPKIGTYCSAVAVFDKIYIVSQEDNLVYDITNNSIKSIENNGKTLKRSLLCLLLYQDRMIAFGGLSQMFVVNSFYFHVPSDLI